MKSRTCRYSIIIGQNAHLMKRLISLLLLFCIGLPLLAQQQRPAQTPKRDQKKKEVAEIDTIPLYNGRDEFILEVNGYADFRTHKVASQQLASNAI